MAGKGSPRTGRYGHPRANKSSTYHGSSMLTPELHELLVTTRRTTRLFDTQVALKCGISKSTLESWLIKGVSEGYPEPYASFAKDYVEASIDQEAEALGKVEQGKNVKGETWWLEKRYPQRWGGLANCSPNKEAVEIHLLIEQQVKRGETLQHLFEDPPDELKRIMRAAAPQILAILESKDEEAPLLVEADEKPE